MKYAPLTYFHLRNWNVRLVNTQRIEILESENSKKQSQTFIYQISLLNLYIVYAL